MVNILGLLSKPKDFFEIYEYIYPYNTRFTNENHYIVLKKIKGKFYGWYYGTTDEFDEVREGYLAGYFVKEMTDLKISKNIITFILIVSDEECYTEPISIKYKSEKEFPKNKYKKWKVGGFNFEPKKYNGIMNKNQIIFKDRDEDIIFNKIK